MALSPGRRGPAFGRGLAVALGLSAFIVPAKVVAAEIEIAIFARGCLSRRVESMQVLHERISCLPVALADAERGNNFARPLNELTLLPPASYNRDVYSAKLS